MKKPRSSSQQLTSLETSKNGSGKTTPSSTIITLPTRSVTK